MIKNISARSIWESALILPDYRDFKESMIQELCFYYKINRQEVLNRFNNIVKASKDEWEAKERSYQKQIVDFYDQSDNYIFEHVQWHINHGHCGESVWALNVAKKGKYIKYLDFGSGIGSTGILFAKNGFNVTVADISSKMLQFAECRFNLRGINGCFLDLKRGILKKNEYEFITAIDVFEHLNDPMKTLNEISSSLKQDGLLFIEATYGIDRDRPMHIIRKGPSIRDFYKNSLTIIFKSGDTLLCKKEGKNASLIRSYINILKRSDRMGISA